MDSPLWMRRMASDRIMLMSTVLILGHCSFWISCGMVLVTTTCPIQETDHTHSKTCKNTQSVADTASFVQSKGHFFLLFKASHTLFLYLTARPLNRFPRKARQEHEYVSKLHHQLQKLTNSFRCKDACTLHPLHTVANTPLQQVLQLH